MSFDWNSLKDPIVEILKNALIDAGNEVKDVYVPALEELAQLTIAQSKIVDEGLEQHGIMEVAHAAQNLQHLKAQLKLYYGILAEEGYVKGLDTLETVIITIVKILRAALIKGALAV